MKDTKMATGYASCARGTGMELMKIGTKIPPPVQAISMLMNLKEKGASLPIDLKTLAPVHHRIIDGGQ